MLVNPIRLSVLSNSFVPISHSVRSLVITLHWNGHHTAVLFTKNLHFWLNRDNDSDIELYFYRYADIRKMFSFLSVLVDTVYSYNT